MSYVGLGIDWRIIKNGLQEFVDFMENHDHRRKMFLTPVYLKDLGAKYLRTLCSDRPLNEEFVARYEELIRDGRLAYLGGYSTIHIDTKKRVIDKQCFYELLQAIINCKGSVELNIHLGIVPGSLDGVKVVREAVPQVEAPVVRVAPPVVKAPVYVPKYSHKAIAAIMAYEDNKVVKHMEKGCYTKAKTSAWEKLNDNALLREAMTSKGNNRAYNRSGHFLSELLWSAVRYITSVEHQDVSRDFFTLLESDSVFGAMHPITALRNKFASPASYASNNPGLRIASVIIAWNAYRDNVECGRIDWDQDKEEFPIAT
jgi:hypothetical protein